MRQKGFHAGDISSPCCYASLAERTVYARSTAEDTCAFRDEEKEFKVIDDNSCPVVVGENLIARMKNFDYVTWRDFQHESVQIRNHLRDKIGVQEASRYPRLFLWDKEYTSFPDYMEGVLKRNGIDKEGYVII